MQSFWKRTERLSIKLTPAILTAMMVLISAALEHIPGFARLMPSLALICIYYWCVILPGALPYWFLFVLGLLQDTLSGLPLGTSSFINVFMAWLIMSQLHITGNTTFSTMWLRFAALSIFVIGLEWFIMSLYYGRNLSTGMLGLATLSSCLSYPLIHAFLMYIYRHINE